MYVAARKCTVAFLSLLASIALIAPARSDAAPKSGGGSTCNPKRSVCSDTRAPSIAIATPSAGSSVSGAVTVAGSASDNVGISRVEVRVDAGTWQAASGAASWSTAIDAAAYGDGTHTISARALDAAGNAASASVSVEFSNAPADVVQNPSVGAAVMPVGRGRTASLGDLSFMLYIESSSHAPWVYVRDASTGNVSHAALPWNWTESFAEASYAVTAGPRLWVMLGAGPVVVREYALSGAALPNAATLASERVFGDADSRPGDIVVAQSGAVVAAWHQHGSSGPQGQRVAYRDAAGSWSQLSLSFMPTASSVQTMAQHPVDGSIWLFCDPDAWGSIGVAHLTDTGSGLSVDWTNAQFISGADGAYDADPENPDVQAVPDPHGGAVALAYQSATRTVFSTNPFVAGSNVAVARISANGAKTFIALPEYAERISKIGVVVGAGETWVSYRPIDATDLSYDDVYVRRYVNGAWEQARLLGALANPHDVVPFGVGRPEFAARLSDGKIHLWSF